MQVYDVYSREHRKCRLITTFHNGSYAGAPVSHGVDVGTYLATVHVEANSVAPGMYTIADFELHGWVLDAVEDAASHA